MTGNIWYILLAFIPALINVGIIFYLIFFLPRSKTTNIFTFFVIALILWQAQDTILRVCDTEVIAGFWYKALCVGWMYVGALSFHFAARYTGSKKLYTTGALVCIYLPFFVLQSLAFASDNQLLFTHDKAWGWVYVPRPGTVDSIQRYWLSVIVIAALFILFRHNYNLTRLIDFNLARKPFVLFAARCSEMLRLGSGLIRHKVKTGVYNYSAVVNIRRRDALILETNSETFRRVDQVRSDGNNAFQFLTLEPYLDFFRHFHSVPNVLP